MTGSFCNRKYFIDCFSCTCCSDLWIAFILYKHFVMTYCVLYCFQLRDPPLNYFVILPFRKISLVWLQVPKNELGKPFDCILVKTKELQ